MKSPDLLKYLLLPLDCLRATRKRACDGLPTPLKGWEVIYLSICSRLQLKPMCY